MWLRSDNSGILYVDERKRISSQRERLKQQVAAFIEISGHQTLA